MAALWHVMKQLVLTTAGVRMSGCELFTTHELTQIVLLTHDFVLATLVPKGTLACARGTHICIICQSPPFSLSKPVFVACRFDGSIAAIRMALSMDDIADAQTEVEVYHCLQQLQGKHVPQLLGYGQSGQGFCVATSYIQVCGVDCRLALMALSCVGHAISAQEHESHYILYFVAPTKSLHPFLCCFTGYTKAFFTHTQFTDVRTVLCCQMLLIPFRHIKYVTHVSCLCFFVLQLSHLDTKAVLTCRGSSLIGTHVHTGPWTVNFWQSWTASTVLVSAIMIFTKATF